MKSNPHLKEILEFVINLAVAFALFSIVYFFLVQPNQIDGTSMVPTFETNNYVISEKVSRYFDRYTRGEIIVFHYPLMKNVDYVKRIIALPGETIYVKNGDVYVNDKLLDEPYAIGYTVGGSFLREGVAYTLKPDELFVMGDNRQESSDSRSWGPVPVSNIVGHVIFRYWPVSEFGLVHSN